MRRWPESREAFEKAQALSEDRWEAVLAEEYDEEILANVRALMAVPPDFLEAPPPTAIQAHLAPPAKLPDLTGQMIAERFVVGDRIGHGGSGDVHEAEDRLTGDTVAIKFVPRSPSGNLLADEAAALRLLRLPGVVHLIEDGEVDDRSYVVMELVDGHPFPGATRGRIHKWSELAPCVAGLLEVLARIHSQGVIHRDLKPGNVLIDDAGRPKVLDLGIAWDAQASGASSAHLALAATPGYASPEQLRGEPATPQSDLFSVGVMLHEALTNRSPVQAPPSPDTLGDDVPADVVAFVGRLLAPKAPDRPVNAAESLALLPDFGSSPPLERLRAGSDRLSAQELQRLFHGPERLLRLPSDAAKELFARTDGVRTDVIEELAAWERAGLAHWDGEQVRVDRTALERLREGLRVRVGPRATRRDPLDVESLAQAALRTARSRFEDGKPARAWALYDDALQALRGRLEPAEMEAAFVEFMRTTVQLGDPRALDGFRYRLERSEVQPELATRLDRIVHAAAAAVQGDAQGAIHLLTSPDSAETDMEFRCLIAVWMFVARLQPPADRDESIRLAEVAARTRGSALALRSVESAKTWRHYFRKEYEAAAMRHAQASEEALTPQESLNAMVSSASSWLEAGDLDAAHDTAMSGVALAARSRLPVHELRAEWICRAAAYRRGDWQDIDQDLVEAADRAGSAYNAAILHLTNAAIAWRQRDFLLGQKLAERACAVWTQVGRSEPAVLARALALACGAPPDPEELATLFDKIRADPDPTGALQGAGLLASVYAAGRSALRTFILETASANPHLRQDICREVISIAESKEFCGAVK